MTSWKLKGARGQNVVVLRFGGVGPAVGDLEIKARRAPYRAGAEDRDVENEALLSLVIIQSKVDAGGPVAVEHENGGLARKTERYLVEPGTRLVLETDRCVLYVVWFCRCDVEVLGCLPIVVAASAARRGTERQGSLITTRHTDSWRGRGAG